MSVIYADQLGWLFWGSIDRQSYGSLMGRVWGRSGNCTSARPRLLAAGRRALHEEERRLLWEPRQAQFEEPSGAKGGPCRR